MMKISKNYPPAKSLFHILNLRMGYGWAMDEFVKSRGSFVYYQCFRRGLLIVLVGYCHVHARLRLEALTKRDT